MWQIYLLMTSNQEDQFLQSAKMLARILFKNKEALALIQRIFPQTLFQKIKRGRSGALKDLAWRENDWINFFTKVIKQDSDLATEIWNAATRHELTEKLKEEVDQFLSIKKIHHETLANEKTQVLVLPLHEFNAHRKVISKQLNLKWNYSEFEVEYATLRQSYWVGGYYLSKLIRLPELIGEADGKVSLAAAVSDP